MIGFAALIQKISNKQALRGIRSGFHGLLSGVIVPFFAQFPIPRCSNLSTNAIN